MQPRLLNQRRAFLGDRLQMDVASEVMRLAQRPRNTNETFHRVVGGADDTRRQEETLDVVTFVELQGKVDDLLNRKACAPDTG